MTDIINHPSHYAEGRKYEPIDVFIDWDLGPLEWQVCKYLSRLGRKGNALEDAKKAQFYMNRLVEELTPPPISVDKIVDKSITTDRIVTVEPQGSTYNITLDTAEGIASDGLDLDETAGEVGNADAKHVNIVRAAKVMASNPGLHL
ncbi:DUF3310 domain-containing protein [Brevibacterium sp. CSND-B09]|uniref:DUF3310 domain-containing protein n=1 Tax=Brevibacterium sp. CSND-B09 TaxID=3462571 RepID=UPI00406A7DB3